MPTYEYRCENGHEFEAFQKMSDEPLTECRECGAPARRKISSGAGLLFKGSGFYITDYRNAGDPSRKAEARAGEAKAGEGGSGGGAGESGSASAGSGASSDTGTSASSGKKSKKGKRKKAGGHGKGD